MARKTRKSRSKPTPKPRPAKAAKTRERSSRPKATDGDALDLLGMNQAIELLKTTRPTFYRWLRAGKVRGMKVGRQWRFERSEIQRFLKGEEPRIELRTDIGPLIETLRQRIDALGVKAVIPAREDEVGKAVSLMIHLAAATGASDIHIAPHIVPEEGEHVGVLRIRVDGVLHVIAQFDVRLLPAVAERWKTMAACDVREKIRPQDGRILVKLKDTGERLDIRVSFLGAYFGESVTARLLSPERLTLDIDAFGFADNDKARLLRAVDMPNGAIIVSGPTGCGKTTVLYGCALLVARPEIKVMTVEDPVEYALPWMVQVPVQPSKGATFASIVRACLRSDPDVILIGEIRDRETLEVAMQVALTGHLVLTTLHTDEAASALVRMVEIGCPPFLIGDATLLIVAQRLVRVLCPHCSEEGAPSGQLMDRAEQLCRSGGLDWAALPKRFGKPIGCRKCRQLGYRGRTLIAETLEVTPEIGEALRRGATVDELRVIAVGQGMTTMSADGARKAAAGRTTLAEVTRVLALQ